MGNLFLEKITKTFSGNIFPTLKELSLDFKEGELYSILGENGSGKSTLLGIISGTILPTDGRIEINNTQVTKKNSKTLFSQHIGLIQQKQVLCEEATILEHAFIVNETFLKKQNLSDDELKNKIKKIIEKWNLTNLTNYLNTKVMDLSDSQQFNTSLLCTILKNPDFLLLDEPASLLNSEELLVLEKNLKEFCKDNKTVIVITHSISQAERLSENLIILQKKLKPKTLHGKFTRDEILHELISQTENKTETNDISKHFEFNNQIKFDFCIQNLSSKKLHNINLTLNNNSFVIIHGLPQDGLEELEDDLCGFKQPLSGKLFFNNKEIKWNEPKELLKNGIHFIPSDCIKRGSSEKAFIYETVMANEILKSKFFVSTKMIKQKTKQMISEEEFPYPPDWNQTTNTLSGGMRQRLVINRELKANPKVLILAQPDKGLDRRSLKAFQEKLLQLRGSTCVLILTRNKALYKFSNLDNVSFYELKEGNILC